MATRGCAGRRSNAPGSARGDHILRPVHLLLPTREAPPPMIYPKDKAERKGLTCTCGIGPWDVEGTCANCGCTERGLLVQQHAHPFDRDYFNGGAKVGGYAHEGYWDYPVHWTPFRKVMELKPESVLEIG